MRVRVRLFALAKQLAGSESIELELAEPANVAQLRKQLATEIPGLNEVMGNLLFAVDAEYASDDTAVLSTSDVACIPPVSGG